MGDNDDAISKASEIKDLASFISGNLNHPADAAKVEDSKNRAAKIVELASEIGELLKPK